MARGFKVADAYVELTVDRDTLRRAVSDLPREAGPGLDRSGTSMGQRLGRSMGDESSRQGRGVGDKLSAGIEMSVVRNSPLIVAGLAGALSAGAPAILAAGTLAFGGLAAAAASTNDEVRAAWAGVTDQVRQQARQLGSEVQGTFTVMADNVAGSLRRMQPAFSQAFAAAAPMLGKFVDTVLLASERALPQFVSAVQKSGPVMEGLGHFTSVVIQGIGEMFATLANHAPAAGASFAALGDIIASLLPVLSELLGQGVELAAIVLPPLAKVLGVVADVLGALGPILPAVVAGFAGMSIVQSATGWFTALADKVKQLPTSLAATSSAMGPLAVAIGGTVLLYQNATTQGQKWSQMLLEGGRAAQTARDQMNDFGTASRETNTGFAGFLASLVGGGAVISSTGIALGEAEQATNDYLASLTPAALAAHNMEVAERDLAFAIGTAGAESDKARDAKARYEEASRRQAAAEADLEMAVAGVTEAMVLQADQALASIDSGFAHRNALNQLEDAQATLAETIKNRTNADETLRTSDEDVARAMLGVEEQAFRTASAFGQMMADQSGLEKGSASYARVVQEQTLAALEQLQQQAGPEMAAAIGQQIEALRRGGVSLDTNSAQTTALAQKIRDMGIAVTQVPGQKYVQIDAPTAAQMQALNALGYRVQTLPNGQVVVYASTGAAESAINYAARPRTTWIRVNTYAGTSYNTGGVATGGRIGEVPMRPARGMATGGEVSGPGTWLSDSVGPFASRMGNIFLSDDEWIIRAASATKYGRRAMAAINAGVAEVIVPSGPARGMATGGSVATGERGPSSGIWFGPGSVVIKIDGVLDRAGARRTALMLREEIQKLDRELS